MKSTTRAVVGGHLLGGRVVVRLVPTGLGDLTLAGLAAIPLIIYTMVDCWGQIMPPSIATPVDSQGHG